MSTENKDVSSNGNFKLMGYYNINDIKYDLLKIIAPYDGYMYNDKDTNKLVSVFNAYLGDLKGSWKIFSYDIVNTEKENAITFDIQIKMQKDRSPKKLKIHVGKLVMPTPVVLPTNTTTTTTEGADA
jgi:hypothetical protein|tara:strand:- start:161 stop:541 length:381 start_codon:yes stop_codon:yes gene_type:complete